MIKYLVYTCKLNTFNSSNTAYLSTGANHTKVNAVSAILMTLAFLGPCGTKFSVSLVVSSMIPIFPETDSAWTST